MKIVKYIFWWILGFLLFPAFLPYNVAEWAWSECWGDCSDWIKLNTCFPIVWDCIHTTPWSGTDQTNAFPYLMGALMKILMTIILVISLLMIVAAWVLMTMKDSVKNIADWMTILKNVATGLALLWASWVILKIINPNFFK
jgi:hypothetical protein